ncbi:ferredoxin [Streptomyces sp. NPDC056910]|uniref:ferredoxin n=1 Tax=unclassified Streptomyces TaxID=2593676 RepID=UPI00362FCF99
MAFKVTIDSQRCQGHGKCIIECPEVFDSDEQGYAVLTMSEIPDDLRPKVRQRVADCPEAAIKIND